MELEIRLASAQGWLILLVEELPEIYSTPTPKGWPEPKKVIDLYLID